MILTSSYKGIGPVIVGQSKSNVDLLSEAFKALEKNKSNYQILKKKVKQDSNKV